MSEKHKRPARAPLLSRLWQLLRSPRLTLFIILVLAALGLVGIFLMQAPSEVASDPESYRQWVEGIARPRYGGWTGLFSALRFFDMFHSPWFLAAGSLLMLNILFCTLGRWKAVISAVGGGEIKQATSFFRTGTDRAEAAIKALPAAAAEATTDVLKKHGYSAAAETSGGTVNIAARKNRLSPLGTFLTHLSLILFVLGFLVTAIWGFRHPVFIVAEGSKETLDHGTGLTLELRSFEDEYWPDGSPKDFRSSVVLYSGEQEVAQTVVRVNSPLNYRGVSFYQASFGPAVRMSIRSDAESLYDGSLPLTQTFVNEGATRYAGRLELPEPGLAVVLLSTAYNVADPVIGEDQVGMLVYRLGAEEPAAFEVLDAGVPLTADNLEFSFAGQEQFSVFQVTRNPGIALVWIACGAMLVGLGLVFYLPYRRLWVLVEPEKGEASRVMVRGAGRSSPGTGEMNAVLQQVKNRLTVK